MNIIDYAFCLTNSCSGSSIPTNNSRDENFYVRKLGLSNLNVIVCSKYLFMDVDMKKLDSQEIEQTSFIMTAHSTFV